MFEKKWPKGNTYPTRPSPPSISLLCLGLANLLTKTNYLTIFYKYPTLLLFQILVSTEAVNPGVTGSDPWLQNAASSSHSLHDARVTARDVPWAAAPDHRVTNCDAVVQASSQPSEFFNQVCL